MTAFNERSEGGAAATTTSEPFPALLYRRPG
jgi:hypothetical protein